MTWRQVLKKWIPPAVLDWKRKRAAGRSYPSWESALVACGSNYSDEALNKFRVERSLLNGRMDGTPPLLMLTACLLNKPNLHILDLGGNCGDHGTGILKRFPHARYTVWENPTLVAMATAKFGTVEFTSDATPSCDIFLTSGTIQYLETPWEFVQKGFESARHVAIFIRNNFSTKEEFRAQTIRLFDNGGGKLPSGYQDAPIRYPNRSILEAELLKVARKAGFELVATLPDPTRSWPETSDVYGGQLVFLRLPSQ